MSGLEEEDTKTDSEMKWRGFKEEKKKARGFRGYSSISSEYASSQSDLGHLSEQDREKDEQDNMINVDEKRSRQRNTERYWAIRRTPVENFIETNIAKSVQNLLKAGNLIAITGFPGSGKSITVQKCVEHLAEEMNIPVRYIHTRKEMHYIYSEDKNFLIVIDGPFDTISYDQNFTSFLSGVRKCVVRCKRLRLKKIVIVIQKEVLNFMKLQFEDHSWKNEFLTLDFSNMGLSRDEERRILMEKIGNNTAEIEDIVSIDSVIYGFPECCRRLSLHERETKEEFLKISIGMLKDHFNKMDSLVLYPLALIVLENGVIEFKDIQHIAQNEGRLTHIFELLTKSNRPVYCSYSQLTNIVKALSDVYIKYDQSSFQFECSDKLVSEAVHKLLFTRNPWRYIEICPVSRLQHLSNDNDYLGCISGPLYMWLCKRIAAELQNNHNDMFFLILWKLQIWNDVCFVSHIMPVLSEMFETPNLAVVERFMALSQTIKNAYLVSALLHNIPYMKINKKCELVYTPSSKNGIFADEKIHSCTCSVCLLKEKTNKKLIKAMNLDNSFNFLSTCIRQATNCYRNSIVLAMDVLTFSQEKNILNTIFDENNKCSQICIKPNSNMSLVPSLSKENLSCSLFCWSLLPNINLQLQNILIELCEKTKSDWYMKVAFQFATEIWIRSVCAKLPYPPENFSSKLFKKELEKICKEKLSSLCQLRCIYLGRQSNQPLDCISHILATVLDRNASASITTNGFFGLSVIIRETNEVNKEAENLLVHEEMIHYQTAKLSGNRIEELFRSHSNLTLVNYSNVKSKGFGTTQARVEQLSCVVLYCHVKGFIPFGESSFPRTIDGFTVDVRECLCTFAINSMRIGDRIGSAELSKSGTLGCFIELSDSTAFITCAHVLYSSKTLREHNFKKASEKIEIQVIDRRQHGESQIVGLVKTAAFDYGDPRMTSVDAALIEMTGVHPIDEKFSEVYSADQVEHAGFSSRTNLCFPYGEVEKVSRANFRSDIIKVGAESGLTIGRLRKGNSAARVRNNIEVTIDSSSDFTPVFYNQFEVLPQILPSVISEAHTPFLINGDSGALIFVVKSDNPLILKAIGMAVAVTSYDSCLMTPIHNVLNSLNISTDKVFKFESRAEANSQGITIKDLEKVLQNVQVGIMREVGEFKEDLKSDIAVSNTTLTNRLDSVDKELHKFNDRLSKIEENEKKTK
ncbi:uncharacterized protein LOC134230690 [Saccostrea cucullata]|uniref:uncharacterized protein LOC134230690 n=1 Tax=Saccostrea cuccullata TaxID=36930 RepID=UPI002ED3A10D